MSMRSAIWGLLALFLGGCGENASIGGVVDGPDGTSGGAHLLALSGYRASVGTLLEVYGTGFPAPDQGRVELLFEGTFTTPDGRSTPVRLRSPSRRVDAGTLRWTGFGPFSNPFSPGGTEIGRFSGTVGAHVVKRSGEQVEDASPLPVDFEVLPSILVHELQPLSATCAGNVLRLLGGAPYRARVEAAGFEPVSFTYTLSAPALGVRPTAVRHLAAGRYDELGARGDFIVPHVPNDMPSYGAMMVVQAQDAEGIVRQTAFAVSVHRPLEVFYNGNVEVAEVIAPAPVSGCIPGGINGREVSYQESQSERRSRSFGVNWNESWLASHTVASGTDRTIGLSEQNGVGFATTDGQTFRWSLGAEVSGELGLSKLVSLGMSTSAMVGGDRSRSVEQSTSREVGINASTTTTETESVSQSAGGGRGAELTWVVDSSSEVSRSFGGHVIAGTYGVFYRQALRLLRRAALVAYNQCGYAEVVGDLDFVDWTWSPDLAMGNACPPLPASNLPSAQCYVAPCSGD